MNIKHDQESILDVNEKGKFTAKPHASFLFPDVYGPLTEEDRTLHFGGEKFKKWTKSRAVVRPGNSTSKAGGSELCNGDGLVTEPSPVMKSGSMLKRPSGKEASLKVVQERRRKLSKMKGSFYEEQTIAMRTRDNGYLSEILQRWDKLHGRRYLISPFADCFLNSQGHLNHGVKSRFLNYSARGNRDVVYPMNKLHRGGGQASSSGTIVSRNIFYMRIPSYVTLQVDVMNALHYRGDTWQRGTSLAEVVTGKMKTLLRPWISGPGAQQLTQVHLHIDDPTLVLPHKNAEQRRRDICRSLSNGGPDDGESAASTKLGFDDDLNVPWSSLLADREYKDELASLHLFCGAVSAFELLNETRREGSVYLHGGSFLLPTTFAKCKQSQLKSGRIEKDNSPPYVKRGIVLSAVVENAQEHPAIFAVPGFRCLIFRTHGAACIGFVDSRHGEAETRFVAVTNEYITPHPPGHGDGRPMKMEEGKKLVQAEACQSLDWLI